MGFFNDFIRGATPALTGGMQIGLQGMAEAQRKKELQAEIQRQAEQQAFENMFKQKEYDQKQGNWQREFDATNLNNQQQRTDDLSQLMMTGQNYLADNALQKRKFEEAELPVSRAQIANLQEPNNRFAAGADPNAAGGARSTNNRNYLLELASKQAIEPSIDVRTGQLDPAAYARNLSDIFSAMERQQNPQQLISEIYNGQQPAMGQSQQQPMQQQVDPNTQRAQQLESKPMQSWTNEELDWYENYINANRQ